MPHLSAIRKKNVILGLLALFVVAAAVVGWLRRDTLAAWYAVRSLAGAAEADRDACVVRVLQFGDAALPQLMSVLGREDEPACGNVKAALDALAAQAQADSTRRGELVTHLTAAFGTMSMPGRRAALAILHALAEPAPDGSLPADIQAALGHVLSEAGMPSELVADALPVAAVLAQQKGQSEEVLQKCRDVVRAGLASADARVRVRSVAAAQQPELNVLDQVVPLLDDSAPDVRRAAILALGPAPEALATDDLLRWLHDSDDDVRRLCETALRGRGLPDQQVRLGKFLTDARPEARLRVLDLLRQAHDVEPAAWLRRLSHDPVAAVRAAAVRAAVEQPQVDLRDRVEQMAQDDPSATVRQLAQYYLRSRQSVER